MNVTAVTRNLTQMPRVIPIIIHIKLYNIQLYLCSYCFSFTADSWEQKSSILKHFQ